MTTTNTGDPSNRNNTPTATTAALPIPHPSTFNLGTLTEICIVTPSHLKTIQGLTALGVGPFQIFNFTSSTVKSRTFRNKPGDWTLTVCFAKHGSLVFEIMEPTGGTSLMSEYLEATGNKEGIQHVAFDMGDGSIEDRKRRMIEKGFEVVQEGIWLGKKGECRFCFFDTLGSVGTTFETIEFSEDWEDPDDCVWFPGPPGEVVVEVEGGSG